MNGRLQGVIPVLQTPLTEDESIATDALQREIDWAFAVGADGVCLAMVSELLRLASVQRLELMKLTCRMVAGRGVVVASVGAETTQQATEYAIIAASIGCDAVMAIPPVTTPLPESALRDYFAALASEVNLPIIVQDASSYVGQPLSVEFMVRLLDEFGPDKIYFKPEGNPVGPTLSALRDASGGRARIFDGSGGIYLVDAYRRGIVGTMPGAELLDGIVALWQALQSGDEDLIYRRYYPIAALVALQLQAGLDGFLAIEKYLLVKRGLFDSAQRCTPIAWSLDPETAAEVDRLFTRLQDVLPS